MSSIPCADEHLPSPPRRPLKVLVVDDDRDTVLTLGILLRSEGVDVRMLRESTQARAAVSTFLPDVVVLDIGMPGRSGYEIAQEVRASFGPGYPVLVALTAHGRPEDREKAFACGFDHHMVKPYNPTNLLGLILSLSPPALTWMDPDATLPSGPMH